MTDALNRDAIMQVLSRAMETRARIGSRAGAMPDTAQIATCCASCGAIGSVVVRYADPPYGPPNGKLWYRTLEDLRRIVHEMLGAPVPPSEGDASARACRGCGAAMQERRIVGVRFVHEMRGSGADLAVQSILDSTIHPASPVMALSRVPIGGAERSIATDADDGAIALAFGRSVTLAESWKRAFRDAELAGFAVRLAEPGYWLFAGAANDARLGEAIEATRVLAREPGIYSLGSLARVASVSPAGGFERWLPEHAAAVSTGAITAGVLLDRDAARRTLRAELARAGFNVSETTDGAVVLARKGELQWPVPVLRVALGGAAMGLYLAEAIAHAVGETVSRFETIERFVAALRLARPSLRFDVRDTAAVPVRPDNREGHPIDLETLPFRMTPGTPEFERQVRYACDEVPSWADASRVCPCGAPLAVRASLVAWAVVERLHAATDGAAPVVLRRLPDESPCAGLVVTLACDTHTRVPLAGELERLGFTGATIRERLAEDLARFAQRVDVVRCEDRAANRAIVVRGPGVSSLALDANLVAGLQDSSGQQLRGTIAHVEVVGGDAIVLHEPAFDPEQVPALVRMCEAPAGVFRFALDARLDAAPTGRFVAWHGATR